MARNLEEDLKREFNNKINYSLIKQTIKELKTMKEEEREKIMKDSYKKIPGKYEPEIRNLTLDFCNDRDFCRSVGINYNNIQTKDSRLIRNAVAYSVANSG